MSVPDSPSPIRRRRLLAFLALCSIAILVYVTSPFFQVPIPLRNVQGLSRANAAHHALQRPPVPELYGLLHLVTAPSPRMFPAANPEQPLDIDFYASAGPVDWHAEARRVDAQHPIIVFSKTTCPHSRRAKALLESYALDPAPHIVEVDVRQDANAVKLLLMRLTGRGTFPNIIVRGTSIGGNDDLQALHAHGQLVEKFQAAGVRVGKLP